MQIYHIYNRIAREDDKAVTIKARRMLHSVCAQALSSRYFYVGRASRQIGSETMFGLSPASGDLDLVRVNDTRVGDDNRLRHFARRRTVCFDSLDNVHTIDDLAEYDMLAVKP